jgi:inner membrane protease subunit 2
MRLLKWWDWDKANGEEGGVDGQKEDGQGYRNSVRERVLKEAVKVERPTLH